MTSVTKVAGLMFAGAAVSLAMVSLTQAATVAVNDETPLTIQAQALSYAAGGQTGALKVTTDGYLFCANVVLENQDAAVISFLPSHSRWTLPWAYVLGFGYTDGVLNVSRPATGPAMESTLSCIARGAQGEVRKPFSSYGDGAFRDGYEALEATQYMNMVNWKPVDGFDWGQPDWSEVPTDSCSFAMTPENSPAVEETALCAAATGIEADGTEFGVRSRKMWTKTVGTSFIYLARIDGRLGAQPLSLANEAFNTPLNDVESLPDSVNLAIRDGYDSQYLSNTGTYCFLTELPATLTTSVCSGAAVIGSLDGLLERPFPLSFLSSPALSRYVVVIRSTTSDYPTMHSPVAAIAVLPEPSTVREESGDGFAGDNVIFGFAGSNDTFPWMTQ